MSLRQAADTTSAAPESLGSRLGELLGIEQTVLLDKALEAVVILLVAWIALRVARFVTTRIQRRFTEEDAGLLDEGDQRARTVAQILYSLAVAIIAGTAVLTILNLFIPIGPLLAGVGVLGLAVSFGAQSLVKDIIAGFFVLVENQYAVGDGVTINGQNGVVERMTLRVVGLRDIEGALHIIPNGSITMVTNKTRGWARVVLDVGVAYRERVDDVFDVLRQVLEGLWEDPEWRPLLVESPEVLGLQELADSSVNLRVVVMVRPGKQWNVRREVLRRIKNRFDDEGIEIPFPQRTLHPGTGVTWRTGEGAPRSHDREAR